MKTETSDFIIPITIGGKTYNVVPASTASRFEQQRNEYRAALANLSLFVSAGLGEENTSAKVYVERIKDGIEHMVQAFADRSKNL